MKSAAWLGVLASLISIGAGLYLLTGESASADTTVFDILMHGIGAYCVARGVWMLYEIAERQRQGAPMPRASWPAPPPIKAD